MIALLLTRAELLAVCDAVDRAQEVELGKARRALLLRLYRKAQRTFNRSQCGSRSHVD